MHLSDDLIAELSDEPKKEAAMRSTEELIAELRDSATAYGPVEGAIYSEAADRLAELEAKVAALSASPTEGENEALLRLTQEMVDAWDWWRVDQYDRCQSVPSNAVDDLRQALRATKTKGNEND